MFWHNVHMPDEYPLTLRQADQARTDFALIESNLELLVGQLARESGIIDNDSSNTMRSMPN